jgi:hypothetical protein
MLFRRKNMMTGKENDSKNIPSFSAFGREKEIAADERSVHRASYQSDYIQSGRHVECKQ